MSPAAKRLRLFSAFGIEIEYMLVAADTLDISPVAALLFTADDGSVCGERTVGDIWWSNELAAHVLELKTAAPVRSFDQLASRFHAQVLAVNQRLAAAGVHLLPGGAHPWMNPALETQLWPWDNAEIYHTYDRIFNCRRHGWANLQSVHLNLPFADDAEFGRLHAAVRLILPLLPALAASTPYLEGRATGQLDTRLDIYRTNSAVIPTMTGQVIPEPVYTAAAYHEQILEPIHQQLAAHDPDGVLRGEWTNARGAIARFDRGAIEIRLLDAQECPAADIAIAALVTAVLQALTAERWTSMSTLQRWPLAPLHDLLLRATRDADQAIVGDCEYLRAFGWPGSGPCTAGALWQHLAGSVDAALLAETAVLDYILATGTLARRLLQAAGPRPSQQELKAVYARLGTCLVNNRPFTPETVAAEL